MALFLLIIGATLTVTCIAAFTIKIKNQKKQIQALLEGSHNLIEYVKAIRVSRKANLISEEQFLDRINSDILNWYLYKAQQDYHVFREIEEAKDEMAFQSFLK